MKGTDASKSREIKAPSQHDDAGAKGTSPQKARRSKRRTSPPEDVREVEVGTVNITEEQLDNLNRLASIVETLVNLGRHSGIPHPDGGVYRQEEIERFIRAYKESIE